MPEIVLILIALAILFYGMVIIPKKAALDIYEDGIYFHVKKMLVPYNSIISIERDCTNSAESGAIIYFSYVITFYTNEGTKDSFRFYRSSADRKKWNNLKAKILNKNPDAFINESIL